MKLGGEMQSMVKLNKCMLGVVYVWYHILEGQFILTLAGAQYSLCFQEAFKQEC
jgi:hypothetical protein